jgi:hypothetical protein
MNSRLNTRRADLGLPQFDLPPAEPVFRLNPVAELVITNTGGRITLKLRVPSPPAQYTLVQGAAPVRTGVSATLHPPVWLLEKPSHLSRSPRHSGGPFPLTGPYLPRSLAGRLCSTALASGYGLMAIFPILALPLLKAGKQSHTGGRSGGRAPDDTAHQTRLQFQPPVWPYSGLLSFAPAGRL